MRQVRGDIGATRVRISQVEEGWEEEHIQSHDALRMMVIKPKEEEKEEEA